MHKVKSTHCYSIPHICSVNKITEEVAEDGLPCQRYERVNLLTHKELETPRYTVFSLEAQVASNQPIKRINTVTLDMQELSTNQLSQLDNLAQEDRVKQINESTK